MGRSALDLKSNVKTGGLKTRNMKTEAASNQAALPSCTYLNRENNYAFIS